MDVNVPEGSEDGGGWSRGRIIGIGLGCLLAVGLVVLLVLGLTNTDEQFTIDGTIDEGKAAQAPDFSLPVLAPGGDVGAEGGEVSLSSLRGRPVVVNLWASWCEPCRAEAPILERIWRQYRAKGVVVLGVNTQDLTRDAKGFLEEFGVTFPSVRDGTDATQRAFETGGLPETFVVDPDGKMRIIPIRGQLTEAWEKTITDHLDTVVGP